MVVTPRNPLDWWQVKHFLISEIPKLKAFSCVLFRKILACHCVLRTLFSCLRTCEQNLTVTTTVSFPSSTPPPSSLLVGGPSAPAAPALPCPAPPAHACLHLHTLFIRAHANSCSALLGHVNRALFCLLLRGEHANVHNVPPIRAWVGSAKAWWRNGSVHACTHACIIAQSTCMHVQLGPSLPDLPYLRGCLHLLPLNPPPKPSCVALEKGRIFPGSPLALNVTHGGGGGGTCMHACMRSPWWSYYSVQQNVPPAQAHAHLLLAFAFRAFTVLSSIRLRRSFAMLLGCTCTDC
jgi:hypothetical protein